MAPWAKRPPGVQQLGCLWACILTAIRPATAEDVTLVVPAASTAAMPVFLDHGAGRHLSRALAVPPNITLVVLPPYSPELNPVERVWPDLRERFLSLRLLHSTDALIDAWLATPGCASSLTPIGSGPFAATPDREGRITDSPV